MKETKPSRTHFPMWRSLLVLHTYAAVLIPCHYRCAFLHTLLLTFHLLALLLVTGILLGHMEGTFLTIVVISAAAPVVTIPLKLVLNYICFLWYYTDRDILKAAKDRERVEVVAQGDAFQFDFYGRRTQYKIPTFRLKKEEAKRRRMIRKMERVVTPELNHRDAFAIGEFTVLADESAAFYASDVTGSPREDRHREKEKSESDALGSKNSGAVEKSAAPIGLGVNGGLYLDEIEIVDELWTPGRHDNQQVAAADGGGGGDRDEEVEPVPLDVTIHTYSQWIGGGLVVGCFFLCWASIRAIGDADAAHQYCTDGTVNTILIACVVVDNVLCEPLYLAAAYLLRHADSLGDEAFEGGDGVNDSSSSAASDSDDDGASQSTGGGSSLSSEARRRRRRSKRRRDQSVFSDIHPIEGTLRRIYVHPDVDELFNTVHERTVDEFDDQAPGRRSEGDAHHEGGGDDANDDVAGEHLRSDDHETLATFQGFSA